MGKAWDSDKGGSEAWTNWMEDVMRECLRVLKPGAHGLVWALPRTSHWWRGARPIHGIWQHGIGCKERGVWVYRDRERAGIL